MKKSPVVADAERRAGGKSHLSAAFACASSDRNVPLKGQKYYASDILVNKIDQVFNQIKSLKAYGSRQRSKTDQLAIAKQLKDLVDEYAALSQKVPDSPQYEG